MYMYRDMQLRFLKVKTFIKQCKLKNDCNSYAINSVLAPFNVLFLLFWQKRGKIIFVYSRLQFDRSLVLGCHYENQL